MSVVKIHAKGSQMPDESFWGDACEPGDPLASMRLLDGAGIAAELPDVSYLVAELGMVSGGGAPHLVAGYGYSGKTVAVQAMLVAMAAGRSVWGTHRVRRARVLHVDLEQGERLTRRRYQRIARAAGIDLVVDVGDHLTLACMPRLPLTIDNYDAWKALMTGRDLVVIDSLRAATGGADENDSTIRVPLDLLGRLSEETGCRALVIHHGRKPNGEASEDKYTIRGSGAIFDACDAVYVFVAAKGEPVSVRQVKARSHGEPIDDFALVIEDVEGAGDDPTWGLSVRVHGKELIAKVREERAVRDAERRGGADAKNVARALSKHPGIGVKELRAATGLGGDRLTAAILALGDRVEQREERVGRARFLRHFLRPEGGAS